MKIIHCADLHLDSKMNANLDRQKGQERKAELLDTFHRMIRYAVEHNVSAIVIAGDLFDTKKVSVTARNAVADEIRDNSGIDFYYLKGNHDADSFLSELEELPDNLKLFGEQWTSYELSEGICITGIELTYDNHERIYDSLVLDTEAVNLVVLHGQESAYQSKDSAEVINISALRNRGIDYLALGHVHAYKRNKLDARGVWCYSGCLEGRGFDECGEHGFVLLDIDVNTHTCIDTFIPFAYRTMQQVEVDISGCQTTMDIISVAQRVLEERKLDSKSLVKFVLTGKVDVTCEKDRNLLLKRFASQFYFVKLQDNSGFAVDYNSFRYDESLKGEFVRTVLASSESEEDKAAIIRMGIQALQDAF